MGANEHQDPDRWGLGPALLSAPRCRPFEASAGGTAGMDTVGGSYPFHGTDGPAMPCAVFNPLAAGGTGHADAVRASLSLGSCSGVVPAAL